MHAFRYDADGVGPFVGLGYSGPTHMQRKASYSAIESGDGRVGSARVVKLVDTRDLKQFEPSGGNSGGEPRQIR